MRSSSHRTCSEESAYEGVTDLSDFESVMYKVEDEDLYLIATSEHSVGSMLMDETVLAENLPIKVCGISPCFRREIGQHGRYTKGLFRVHQFHKIEQFIFSTPEQSWDTPRGASTEQRDALRGSRIALPCGECLYG